jgi:uncharacterized protein (DUF934 family)
VSTLLKADGSAHRNTYTALDDDATPAPEGCDLVVSLRRWERDRERLIDWPGRIGVRIKGDETPAAIVTDLDAIDMIALEFPTFRDGRAYSHARLLRDRYGYRGEIRAVGDVLVEQLAFMLRVGFDAFEVEAVDATSEFRTVTDEISVQYQPSSDGRVTALERRHAP